MTSAASRSLPTVRLREGWVLLKDGSARSRTRDSESETSFA
jgi:hypothetical protein